MTTTNIRPFVSAVKTAMESRLCDYDITEKDIVKMNDVTLHGLVARREGEDAGATVYLEEPFERYLEGANLIDIADELSEIVLGAESRKPASNLDLSFEAIKDSLTIRLVDMAKNKAYLEEHPYRIYGAGLVAVAEISLGNNYSVVVTNSIAEDYDIIDLFDTAIENMQALYPARLVSLEGAVFGDRTNILESNEKHIEGAYTLMIDEEHGFGASAIMYDGIADRVRALYGSDYYILPSSLHEVILIKDDGFANEEELKAMVIQANRTVVDPTDILSDDIFHYSSAGLRRVA